MIILSLSQDTLELLAFLLVSGSINLAEPG
jgi:hypothetical protein